MASKKRVRRSKPSDPRVAEILAELSSLGSEGNRAGMARFGINVEHAFGVSVVVLRKLARRWKRDHLLAQALWATGQHEARLLACFVDDPAQVNEAQMEAWALDFNSWDLCDQATILWSRSGEGPFAWIKAKAWAGREEEWVKRAAFSMMAGLATHDKQAKDAAFSKLFPLIVRGAFDERNFVKKSVNWALRGIGKRNLVLHGQALACAERILAEAERRDPRSPEARAARWVAKDAIRELTAPKTRARVAVRSA
ncbi:MAG: DNA alkylation repair protein [Deltaproteobacteria bacterium]|nr:DNA alkylation repair protein [Deltaproteobacteria bacterium]